MSKDIAIKKNTLPIPALSDSKNLDSYIQYVNSSAILTKEEEEKYARLLVHQNDIEAAQKLILSHLRFVVKVARGFSGYGLPMIDLIQEGNIGLMKAVKRFDPDIGVRLVSFAVHWIKAEIYDYVIKNWRIVRVATTKSQRKLFFNLRSSKKRLGWFSKEEINDIASDLGVKPEVVIEMEKRMNDYDVVFDSPSGDESESFKSLSPSLYLEDKTSNLEDVIINTDMNNKVMDQIQMSLSKLDDRTKTVIKSRWFDEPKKTLNDLALEFNVSAERIRQIEEDGFKRLKKSVLSLNN